MYIIFIFVYADQVISPAEFVDATFCSVSRGGRPSQHCHFFQPV